MTTVLWETLPRYLLLRLLEAGNATAAASGESALFQTVTQARRLSDADAVALWRPRSDSPVPTLLAADQRSQNLPDILLGEPLVEKIRAAFEQNISIVHVDTADPLVPRFASTLILPIRCENPEICAVLVVYAHEKRLWTVDGETTTALSLFAPHIARALEHMHLSEIVLEEAVARHSARETERLKTEFVSTVSHELRTPLTIIKGYSDLLTSGQAGDLSETQHRFLEAIQRNTTRLTELLNDLLDMAQVEQGHMKFKRDSVEMGRLVADTSADHTVSARERGIILESTIAEGLPSVNGDPRRLRQVLGNLIGNALKYSPSGSTVRIFCALQSDPQSGKPEIVISVRDQGDGIPENARARIFEKFYRVDSSLTREIGGSGLGLAIAKEIVEQHHGRIWMEAAQDRGSIFAFALPFADEPGNPK